MSIDYGRLAEQLHTTTGREHSRAPWQVGTEDKDGFFDVRDTDYNPVAWRMTHKEAELVALAPDLARELLRLRDGVEQVREMCLLERDAAFQETPMRGGEVKAFTICAEQLATLLDGDTK